MFDPTQPFVLLDDVAAGRARLFTGPVETLVARAPADVAPALARLAEPGPWAGCIGYEAGLALEPRLAALGAVPPPGEPLLWMGRFADVRRLDDAGVAALLGAGPAGVGAIQPAIAEADHAAAVARCQALIAAGDIYQANLTLAAHVPVAGHPLHLYARLRGQSQAPHGALVFTGRHWLLSFSPELFFRLDGRRLTARPMKGTATRGSDAAADRAAAAALAADAKNRAENLMIVDLIRNDLSRVAVDVAVPALFQVETYPTIMQMTSTVTAMARPGVTAADVLAALFPCGSITGAPKIRAQQVIEAVEAGPRGAYTGAIGAIDGNGDAAFNVAIRTLVLARGQRAARLGLGSGIVADSDAAAEWRECLAKAAFLDRRGRPDLIETLRCVAGTLPDLDWHLDRMAASAAFLGHRFDRTAAADVAAGVAAGDGRVRLLAGPSGAVAALWSPPPPPLPGSVPERPVPVRLLPLPVAVDDWRLRHKTTDRGFYDAARRAAGTAEVVFVTPDGHLTEGSFTSVFVARDGRLLTPAGPLLPGVLRARLLATGRAVTAALTPADLAGGFWIGNALRGLMPATLVI